MTTPAKAADTAAKAAKRAPARKAPAKATPYTPTVKDNGKLDHTTCTHPRDPKNRAACRAAQKPPNEPQGHHDPHHTPDDAG